MGPDVGCHFIAFVPSVIPCFAVQFDDQQKRRLIISLVWLSVGPLEPNLPPTPLLHSRIHLVHIWHDAPIVILSRGSVSSRDERFFYLFIYFFKFKENI
jgi:hypothetical protein